MENYIFQKKISELQEEIRVTFISAHKNKAQDILIVAGARPIFKMKGLRSVMKDLPIWTNETFDVFIGSILMGESAKGSNELETQKNYNKMFERKMIDKEGAYDFHLTFGSNNLRCHMFASAPKGKINGKVETTQATMSIRVVPKKIPEYSDLNLPDISPILTHKSGLVLIAGLAGEGKSTTVASLVNIFNQTDDKLRTILTIEEPIEFIHKNNHASIIQRRVGDGEDVPSYSKATEDALREDVDYVILQELRKEEEMNNAIRLVETGKFVIATIHSTSVADTFDRILGEFKHEDKDKTKNRLIANILAIVHQTLITSDSEQYPLVSMLIVENKEIREKLRTAFLSPKHKEKIEELIKETPKEFALTKEEGFDYLVGLGVVKESVRVRFF